MHKTDKPRFVDPAKTRSAKMRRYYDQIEADGICPFCPEHWEKHLDAERVHLGENWLVTNNQYPYENTREHFMLISTYHATTMAEIKPESWQELGEILAWLEKTYQADFGGVGWRFGDFTQTAASVAHFHLHVMMPNRNANPETQDNKVRFKITP